MQARQLPVHVVDAVPLLALPQILLYLISCQLLHEIGMQRWKANLCSMAFILNCNALNVLCEGQHAQVFCAPFVYLILHRWTRMRSDAIESITADIGHAWKERIFIGLLLAAVLVSYPEAALAMVAVVAFAKCGDLLLAVMDRRYRRFEFGMLWALLFGALLALLVSISLPGYYMAQIHHLHTAGGFWQPQWASPLEIIGFADIYDDPVTVHVGRTALNLALVTGFSILILELIAARPAHAFAP